MYDNANDRLRSIVGDEYVTTEEPALTRGSKDFYWFSPVLKPQLDGKHADVIVHPGSVNELKEVIRLAVREEIPVTLRGAGTGNYGQGVPMQGGILLNVKRLDRILHLTTEYAHVQAGTLLNTIEQQARTAGAELRFFPSTLLTATAGGFLAGGSAGIGSVTWGTLWDEGNVRGATVVTVEEEPRVLTVEDPESLRGVIHNCGLTCVIVDLTFALAPARAWQQYVLAFNDFEEAVHFGHTVAADDQVNKRLVTVLDWPIPSFCRQLANDGACPQGRPIVLLHTTLDRQALNKLATGFGGSITWHSPHEHYQRNGWQLSDYSWNHTTLWAMKADPHLTYLQDMFDPERMFEQLRLRKERYGDDILDHIEFMKFEGRLVPQGLSVVRFRSREHLWEIIEFCESIGMWVANPHTHYLDEDVRWNGQPILDARERWDPHGLLNPGHLRVLEGT